MPEEAPKLTPEQEDLQEQRDMYQANIESNFAGYDLDVARDFIHEDAISEGETRDAEKEIDLNELRDRMRSGEVMESHAPKKTPEDEAEIQDEKPEGPSLSAIREAAKKPK